MKNPKTTKNRMLRKRIGRINTAEEFFEIYGLTKDADSLIINLILKLNAMTRSSRIQRLQESRWVVRTGIPISETPL
jgi:hypothetical protein